MSESEHSADSHRVLKRFKPPEPDENAPDASVEASPSQTPPAGDSSDEESDENPAGRDPSLSELPTKIILNMNSNIYDKSDDEEDMSYLTEIPYSQELTLKISNCVWVLRSFSTGDLNTQGGINSLVYAAGPHNEIQWYFRIDKIRQSKEVFYGVYANLLTPSENEIKIEFETYMVEQRGLIYRLGCTPLFPQKVGFKFLGFMRKNHIQDKEYWANRIIPDDVLTLTFKIKINFKKCINHLSDNMKSLLETEKNSDFNLVVKETRFACHKSILAARSSVFSNLISEKQFLNEHEIEDIEPEVMKDLLRYLYTGRIKRLIKYLEDFSTVADKYKLTELKSICDKAKLSF